MILCSDNSEYILVFCLALHFRILSTCTFEDIGTAAVIPVVKMKYCLYARKSTEDEEKQALSIDSQVKEMLAIAERENIEIIDIRREAHSAKESGQRPVFKEILEDIRRGRFNGILVWHPDRLSRNAGDQELNKQAIPEAPPVMKYCLYARKSSEAEYILEKGVLEEKRELMQSFTSKLILINKRVVLE